jgi:hypothetical protein
MFSETRRRRIGRAVCLHRKVTGDLPVGEAARPARTFWLNHVASGERMQIGAIGCKRFRKSRLWTLVGHFEAAGNERTEQRPSPLLIRPVDRDVLMDQILHCNPGYPALGIRRQGAPDTRPPPPSGHSPQAAERVSEGSARELASGPEAHRRRVARPRSRAASPRWRERHKLEASARDGGPSSRPNEATRKNARSGEGRVAAGA